MKLLGRFPILVMAMVLLGIVGVCAAEKSVEVLLVAATLAALSWYITEGPRGRTLPRWVANILVVAVALSVVVDVMLSPGDPAGALGRLIIWLTIIKLYQRRTARDHAQLMALSLLLMLGGCLRTQQLLFGIVLLLYAAIGLWTVLLYQLYASHESVTAAHRAPTGGGAVGPPPAPTLGRRVTLHFRLLALGIGVSGGLLSVLLFVIFPRTAGRGLSPYLGLPARTAVTAYTDEIDLDGGTRITESGRIAFDVRLVDEAGRPLHFDEPLRLRGGVLDRYQNGRWTASIEPLEPIDTEGGVPRPLAPAAGGPLVVQAYRFRDGTATLFTLDTPVAIRTPRSARVVLGEHTGTLRAVDPPLVRGYTLTSRAGRGVADPGRDETPAGAEREPRLGFVRAIPPPDAARVRDLARAVLEGVGVSPDAPPDAGRGTWTLRAARALRDHLRSDAFQYTLDVSDVVRRDTDPTISFLFETRRGHCEFFASALAGLCQAVGVDARVVTGYLAGEHDPLSGEYRVRESSAHAWIEVPAGPRWWVALDPTPPAGLDRAGAGETALTERIGWLYQRLEGSWSSGIIQFDDRSQDRLLEALATGWFARLASLLERTQEWMAQVNRAFHFGPAGYIWLGIVGLAVLIALVAVVRAVRRYRHLRRALHLVEVPGPESRRLTRQLGFYPKMLDVLRRAGAPKPTWQPPLAFARRLRRENPRAARLVRRVASLYYEARYARRYLSAADRTRAERLVVELEQTLRGAS